MELLVFKEENSTNYINLINNNTYLVNLYNKVRNSFDYLPTSIVFYKNIYFFWYCFNNDSLITFFINLFMKDGKKYTSYKQIYNTLFFIKKLTGFQPIIILKQFLCKHRILFDFLYKTTKEKIFTFPKLLSVKSQITKSLKWSFNNFNLNNWKINKKTTPFYKKLGYLILNNYFNVNSLLKIISKDYILIKENFFHISKEEFLNKYVNNVHDIKKKECLK